MAEFTLTVLGTRGSMAVDGADYTLFGGATSCYMIRAGEETVFWDVGSGLIRAEVDFPKPPVILISHLHLDHLLGLGMYPRLTRKGLETRICVPASDGADAEASLNQLYSPPLWPVSMKLYAGDIRVEELSLPMRLGEVLIEGMAGSHPGDCVIMKLSYKGRSVVYMTDYEHQERFSDMLIDFVREADLVLYDGQYKVDEYETKKGFGHSTVEKGAELMDQASIRKMLIVHHDPQSTDEILLEREKAIGRKDIRFARQGETIELL